MMWSPFSQLKDSCCLQWGLDKGSCWKQESFICQKFFLLKMTFWGGLLELKQPVLASWSISVLSLQSSPLSSVPGVWRDTAPSHPMPTRQAECNISSKLNNLTSDQILAAIPAVSMVANTSLGCCLSHSMAGQFCFLQRKFHHFSELCHSGQARSGFLASSWQHEGDFSCSYSLGLVWESFSALPTHQLGFLQDSVGIHMVPSEKDPPLPQTQHSILCSGKSMSAVL